MAEEWTAFGEKPLSRCSLEELESERRYWTDRINARRLDSVTKHMVDVRKEVDYFIALRKQQRIGGIEP